MMRMAARRAAIDETLPGAPKPQRRSPAPQHARRLLVLLLLLALVLLACRPLTRRWRVVHLGTISTCLPDALTGASPPHPAATGADHERYLFYSPQFGHSNQLVALRNAAAWAAVLNRTLVLPHLLGHATEREYEAGTPVRRPMATYAAAFDLARARTATELPTPEEFAAMDLAKREALIDESLDGLERTVEWLLDLLDQSAPDEALRPAVGVLVGLLPPKGHRGSQAGGGVPPEGWQHHDVSGLLHAHEGFPRTAHCRLGRRVAAVVLS